MSILLVYPVAIAVIGAVVYLAMRRGRAQRRATPPWEGAWIRGERYDDTERRQRRNRAVAGGFVGVLVAIPAMILAGFAGTAKGVTRQR